MTINHSIIQKSQLEAASRLDAEFYQLKYHIDFSKGDWKPISEVIKMCQYGISQAMNEGGIGYPIFRMDNIKNAFLVNDKIKYVDIPLSVFRQYELTTNDILFNRVNSEEFVGRTGIFKLNRNFVFASYLIRLRVKNDAKILPDYLNIFLNSSFGIKQIRKFRRRAVNQANVNAEELKQIKIAVLPLRVQKEIKNLSNESWRQFEISNSYYLQAESLLLEKLGLKDSEIPDDLSYLINFSEIKNVSRIDADYFQPKYNKLISKIKNHSSKSLVKLVSVKKGIEPGSEAYQEEGKLFIRVSSVTKQGIIDKDQKYLSDELYQKLKDDYRPEVREILLTKDATPGLAYVVKEPIEGIVSGGILRLKPKKSIEAEYLALCINSTVGQLQAERDAGGSIIKHWRPDQIENLQIPILPKSTQQTIAVLVKKSHGARKKSKELLEKAKKKVEEMIVAKAKN